MKQLGEFQLEYSERAGRIARGPKKRIPVEVLIDGEHTVVLVDCGDCRDLLKNKLPGGVLIPIVSVFRKFFKSRSGRSRKRIHHEANLQRSTGANFDS